MASPKATQISASLNQIYGENVNKKFELKGSEVLIGRGYTANIRLECASVSRKHCILTYTDKGWAVKDTKSQNGTWVSGQKLKPNESRLLDCGDIIFLGPPAELPQAFCFEINYDTENPTEFSVEESKEKGRDVSLKLDDSLEDPKNLCVKHFSPKKTPMKGTSFALSDDEILLISPEKKFLIEESANVENDADYFAMSIPHTESFCKRKLAGTSQASSSSCSEPKKSKSTPSSPDNIQDFKSDKLNKELGDQINEISSTENDQTGESQSLLDVKNEDIPDQSCQSDEKSEAELLKSQISKMAAEIKKLKSQRSLLVGQCKSARRKENDTLKKQFEEHQKLKEDLQSCEEKAKNEIKKEIMEKFEEDLICNICTELLIKPTVLECSHTFCEYCIHEWKKKKNECPMCRSRIQTMTRVLTLENFIDKSLETLTPEQRVKREELIKERLMAEQQKTVHKSPGYPRSGRRRRGRRVITRDATRPNVEIPQRRNLLLPIPLPPISYPLFINNPNFRVPEVIISDNEMDTINIYVS